MKKLILVLLVASLTLGCNDDDDDAKHNIICQTELTEGTETLSLEWDYGDTETVFEFELYKYLYSVKISFDQETVNSYKNSIRTLSYYENEAPPSTQDFYNLFLNDDKDLPLLQSVLKTLNNRNIGKEHDLVQLIVSFVQAIPYDEYAQEVNYPYETIAYNKGDCDEKSILLSKLLNIAGYNTCLFYYENEQHMAVGLKVADQGYYKNGYVFIESTNTFPIGKKVAAPNGKTYDEEPKIIYPNNNGKMLYNKFDALKSCYEELESSYGTTYLHQDIKGKRLLEKIQHWEGEERVISEKIDKHMTVMDSLKVKIDALNENFDELNCSNAASEEIYKKCITIQDELKLVIENHNDVVTAYNKDVKRQNQINNKCNDFKEKFNKMNKK